MLTSLSKICINIQWSDFYTSVSQFVFFMDTLPPPTFPTLGVWLFGLHQSSSDDLYQPKGITLTVYGPEFVLRETGLVFSHQTCFTGNYSKESVWSRGMMY